MSYKDLLYDGQLWALEQMTKEKAEDPPDLAEQRLLLVIFKNKIFKINLLLETQTLALVESSGVRNRRYSQWRNSHLRRSGSRSSRYLPRLARNRRGRHRSRVIIRFLNILKINFIFLAPLWKVEILDESEEGRPLNSEDLKLRGVSGERKKKQKGAARLKMKRTKIFEIILPSSWTAGTSGLLDKLLSLRCPQKAKFERPWSRQITSSRRPTSAPYVWRRTREPWLSSDVAIHTIAAVRNVGYERGCHARFATSPANLDCFSNLK